MIAIEKKGLPSKVVCAYVCVWCMYVCVCLCVSLSVSPCVIEWLPVAVHRPEIRSVQPRVNAGRYVRALPVCILLRSLFNDLSTLVNAKAYLIDL